MFLTSYGDNNIYRFGPIADGPSPDFSKPWDHGIATDAGGRRVAILDWCANDAVECVVGVRTRSEDNSGPDYTFGAMQGIESMSIDATGQWPLLVVDRQNEQVVFMFANGAWHELAHGNAADW